MRDGDRNTRYYHTKTIIRRRRNKVLTLRNEEGIWIDDNQALKKMVVDYYRVLFEEEEDLREIARTGNRFPTINPSSLQSLAMQVQPEEIKAALFSIGSFKSPGEDGFPAIFFHANWDLVGTAFSKFIESAWSNPSLIH